MKGNARQRKWVKMDVYISGMMLVELLIVMMLGLLVLSMIMELYLASQRSMRMQEAIYQLQDEAQTAARLLREEIHKAGYIGCARLTHDFPVSSHGVFNLTPENKLSANKNDEITIRYGQYPHATIVKPLQDKDRIFVTTNVRFIPGDILMISDCNRAEIFTVKQVKHRGDKQEILMFYPLNSQFENYAEVSRFEVNRYFIEDTHRKNEDGSPVYALMLEDIHHKKNELVPGIERMRFKYTISTSGTMKDVEADEVRDWSQVSGVAIELDVRAAGLKKTWPVYSFIEG